jgi:putative ABC transport system permease protein
VSSGPSRGRTRHGTPALPGIRFLKEQSPAFPRLPNDTQVLKKPKFRPTASFWEANRIALDSLRKNKLRSFLTLLGIILATTTLIVVTALIHGMNLYIAEKVSDMGADGFRIVRMAWFGPWDPKKFYEMLKRNPEIKREEYEFVKSKATLLRDLGMMVNRRGRVSCKGESMPRVEIDGITDNIPVINNVGIALGRSVAAEEVRRHATVAFIGNDLATRFFAGVDPIGKTIQIEGNPYEVIGVAKTLGSVFGQSQDNFVMIPIESYFKTYGSRSGIELVAKAVGQEHLMEAQDEARVALRAYRHLRPNQDDNFSIFASETFVTLWNRLTGAIAGMAVGIVSVFMVVGGIVIMNIMLAAVTERTHEIGIRKSLGARRRDILNQFLIESSFLSGTGGFIGVVIAWFLAIVVRNTTPVPMALPWSSVFLGVGLSAVVGLFFGIYPARRASRLDPIEALRVER